MQLELATKKNGNTTQHIPVRTRKRIEMNSSSGHLNRFSLLFSVGLNVYATPRTTAIVSHLFVNESYKYEYNGIG